MRALLDLTTIPPGQEQHRLDAFVAATPDTSPEELTILAPPNAVATPHGSVLMEVDGDPGDRWAAVKSRVADFLTNGRGPGVVASFQHSVAALIEESGNEDVSYFDLRRLLQPHRLTQWPEQHLPRQQAFGVLKRALTQRGGTIRFTGIRPAMTLVDPRFKKNTQNPSPTDRPNFISLLVDEAVAAGLVTVNGPKDNPYVSLVDAPATAPAIAEPSAPDTPSAGFARESDRYLHLLRSADLGPFQQVRVAIFDQIARSVAKSKKPLTVGALLDGAVKKVRQDIESARDEGREYLVRKSQNLPWSQVRGFIGILFTRNAVLQGAEGPIRADWLHLNDEVTGLADGWQQVLDAELVTHLVRKGCLINQYTEVDLSGALYNSRLDLDHVHEVLKYLLESATCGYTEDYSLKVL